MEGDKPVLVIVIPCYNEEEVFSETAESLSQKTSQLVSLGLISQKSTLFFVDDGSKDHTWSLIEKHHRKNPQVINGIKLSVNIGHQNALLCGLLSVRDYADVTVSIDADLQDDINAIEKMIEYYLAGSEIVYGVRSGRGTDGFFKKTSAGLFYRLMCFMGADLVYNHADFRLMARKVLDALAGYNEENLFLRGIVPTLGFKADIVYYKRRKRSAGKSKYTLWKMLKLALNGIALSGIIGKRRKKNHPGKKHCTKYRIEKILFPAELMNAWQ